VDFPLPAQSTTPVVVDNVSVVEKHGDT